MQNIIEDQNPLVSTLYLQITSVHIKFTHTREYQLISRGGSWYIFKLQR